MKPYCQVREIEYSFFFFCNFISGRAYLKEWSLVLYGTTINPDRRKRKLTINPVVTSPASYSASSVTMSSSSKIPTKIIPSTTTKPPLVTWSQVSVKSHQLPVQPTQETLSFIVHNDIDDKAEDDIPLSDSHRNIHEHRKFHLLSYIFHLFTINLKEQQSSYQLYSLTQSATS